jgi:WD40 repeat protein
MLSARSALAIVTLALTASSAAADEAAKVKAYAKEIAQAQADVSAGKTDEAKKRLEATDKALRSFEFDYLMACTAADKATPAGLIRTIPRPKATESRYGVLNGVTRQMAYVCRDGSLLVHDLEKPNTEAKKQPHAKGSAIWAGAFSRDGKTFIAGHENGDVIVWDAKEWKTRHTVNLGGVVRELAVAPDGTAFVAEGKTDLELWSLAEAQPKKVAGVGDRYNFGEGLAFSPKGDRIATGGMFDILLFDAKTGEKSKTAMRHASYTMGLEFSPDGKRIASAPRGNVNKFFAVFDIAAGKAVFNAGPFGDYVAGMAFTPDGRRVAATGCEKVLRLFDATTGEIVLSWARKECGAKPDFSADGALLGWSEPDGYHYIDLGQKPEKK